jgi:hypothetical protein
VTPANRRNRLRPTRGARTHVVTFVEPVVRRGEASFCWTVEPPTELYRETNFRLKFPSTVDLANVPEGLWWRIALMCLHAHWPLLRPCVVKLPVRLTDDEREFWLRLMDAEVATLEAYGGTSDTDRTITIRDRGRHLEDLHPFPSAGRVVTPFSGGRDSLVQAAILAELGEHPILVTTTAPGLHHDHDNPRRDYVLREIQRRRPVELVEVETDLRTRLHNGFAWRRYSSRSGPWRVPSAHGFRNGGSRERIATGSSGAT